MTTALVGVALRLHGPLQAWGSAAIGDNRPTLPFPSRSGVLGLVAACIGIRRGETQRLCALAAGARVHVRVDAAGTPIVDDQTIQDNPNASTTRQTIQSKRTYLCDASFVAVVSPGPEITTSEIIAAVKAPAFSPFLGRRSCVPLTPLLASQEAVEASDPIGLFATIQRGPVELFSQLDADGANTRQGHDYYLDVDHFPGPLRRIPVRDDLTGPLVRQWRERVAVHVRVAP